MHVNLVAAVNSTHAVGKWTVQVGQLLQHEIQAYLLVIALCSYAEAVFEVLVCNFILHQQTICSYWCRSTHAEDVFAGSNRETNFSCKCTADCNTTPANGKFLPAPAATLLVL